MMPQSELALPRALYAEKSSYQGVQNVSKISLSTYDSLYVIPMVRGGVSKSVIVLSGSESS